MFLFLFLLFMTVGLNPRSLDILGKHSYATPSAQGTVFNLNFMDVATGAPRLNNPIAVNGKAPEDLLMPIILEAILL